jgi:hypothetical protein
VISRAQGADFLRRRIVEGDWSNMGRIRGCHKLKSLSSRGVLVSIQAWSGELRGHKSIRRHISQQFLEISSSSLALENGVRKRGKSSKVIQYCIQKVGKGEREKSSCGERKKIHTCGWVVGKNESYNVVNLWRASRLHS